MRTTEGDDHRALAIKGEGGCLSALKGNRRCPLSVDGKSGRSARFRCDKRPAVQPGPRIHLAVNKVEGRQIAWLRSVEGPSPETNGTEFSGAKAA